MCQNNIYSTLLELCNVPSVSPNVETENNVADLIYEKISSNDYFKKNPELIKLAAIDDDPNPRKLVFGVVKSDLQVEETIILTGHFDVVEPNGPIKELIFDPPSYTKEIANHPLDKDSLKDLNSGNWLFGRGVADMKSGVSVAMEYISNVANAEIKLNVNVAFLFVPDEENDSRGMLGAMTCLRRFEKELSLKFIGCVNTEPSIAPVEGGAPEPSIYLGSIGKINPFIYILGKRMHLGEYHKGVSASLIASYLNLNIEGNLSLADSSESMTYLPIGCHMIKNIEQKYGASIVDRMFILYGCLPVKKYPEQILKELVSTAEKSMDRALRHVGEIQCRYLKNADDMVKYESKIMTYEELREMYYSKFGDQAEAKINEILASQDEAADMRSRALDIATEMVDSLGIDGPCIIIGFMFPCYPFIENRTDYPEDKYFKEIASEVVSFAEKKFNTKISVHEFFEGASDLSYCGLRGRGKEYLPYINNVPGWGKLYSWPLSDMEYFDFPVINIGPWGKDLHKYTERVNVEYAVSILPELLQLFIRRISDHYKK